MELHFLFKIARAAVQHRLGWITLWSPVHCRDYEGRAPSTGTRLISVRNLNMVVCHELLRGPSLKKAVGIFGGIFVAQYRWV